MRRRLELRSLRLAKRKSREQEKRLGLSVGDLFSAAYVGLNKAAARFDPRLGWRFCTFAAAYMESEMEREAARLAAGPVGRWSRSLAQRRRVVELQEKLEHQEGRPAAGWRVAETLADDLAVGKRGRRSLVQFVHTLEPTRDVTAISQTLHDPRPSPLAAVLGRERIEALTAALAKLPARTADVVHRRFGLAPYSVPAKLSEIGEALGLSRPRVFQILEKALDDLRRGDDPAFVRLRGLADADPSTVATSVIEHG
ncbi:MAG: sigma-70 family RNA polymerase sigma factor [Planctomycetia bacterium]